MLTLTDFVLRLTAATVIAAIVGIDREARGKPAGMRTHALVSLGSAIAMVTTLHLAAVAGLHSIDPMSRVIQGVLAGVGFLGAGAILKSRDGSDIHGLTTAASIWIVAALGLACGAGEWPIAITAAILAVGMLTIGTWFEDLVHRFIRPKNSRPNHEEREN